MSRENAKDLNRVVGGIPERMQRRKESANKVATAQREAIKVEADRQRIIGIKRYEDEHQLSPEEIELDGLKFRYVSFKKEKAGIDFDNHYALNIFKGSDTGRDQRAQYIRTAEQEAYAMLRHIERKAKRQENKIQYAINEIKELMHDRRSSTRRGGKSYKRKRNNKRKTVKNKRKTKSYFY